MDIERLKVLQAHLFALSRIPIAKRPRAFNMLTWFSRGRKHGNEFCGTAACALGEAGLIPAFRAEGLKTDRRSGDVKFLGDVKNEEAAMAFFDIDNFTVSQLFHPWQYPGTENRRGEVVDSGVRRITPAAVAKRIGHVVEAYSQTHRAP